MPEPQFLPRNRPADPDCIWTHSIVSHRTRRGIVIVEWGGQKGQFDPEDARVFAHRLLREADNAETDSFLYSFFKEKTGASDSTLAALITDFRAARAQLEQAAGLRRTGDEIPEDDRR